jgi:hypothetical protein
MKHSVTLKSSENAEYEGQVFLNCQCGWEAECHTTFAKAIKDRHLSLSINEVINDNK